MLDENLDIFTTGIFATQAKIDGVKISGIFDENYEPMFDSNLPSEGKKVVFHVQSSQIVDVHGSEVELNNRTFEVTGVQPVDDGKMTNLILKEVE
jgi:hypothetical protein